MGCSASIAARPAGVQISAFLTARQLQLVKYTWDVISDDMESTGLLVYSRFLEMERDLRRYFPQIVTKVDGDVEKTTLNGEMLQRHAMIVMEGLGAAVESIEDSACLHAILLGVGQKHYDMGVNSHHLERLWPAVDYGLKEVLRDVYTHDVRESWRQIFQYIITKMREGMTRKRQTGLTKAQIPMTLTPWTSSFGQLSINVSKPVRF